MSANWKRQQEEQALKQKDPAAYARLITMRTSAIGAADQFQTDVILQNEALKASKSGSAAPPVSSSNNEAAGEGEDDDEEDDEEYDRRRREIAAARKAAKAAGTVTSTGLFGGTSGTGAPSSSGGSGGGGAATTARSVGLFSESSAVAAAAATSNISKTNAAKTTTPPPPPPPGDETMEPVAEEPLLRYVTVAAYAPPADCADTEVLSCGAGTVVALIARGATWCRVRLDGREGWLPATVVKEKVSSGRVPAYSPEPAESPAAAGPPSDAFLSDLQPYTLVGKDGTVSLPFGPDPTFKCPAFVVKARVRAPEQMKGPCVVAHDQSWRCAVTGTALAKEKGSEASQLSRITEQQRQLNEQRPLAKPTAITSSRSASPKNDSVYPPAKSESSSSSSKIVDRMKLFGGNSTPSSAASASVSTASTSKAPSKQASTELSTSPKASHAHSHPHNYHIHHNHPSHHQSRSPKGVKKMLSAFETSKPAPASSAKSPAKPTSNSGVSVRPTLNSAGGVEASHQRLADVTFDFTFGGKSS